MNTLYATDILDMAIKLQHAEDWIAKVRADSAPDQIHRLRIICEDISAVRRTLLRASCADVAVETTEAA